MPPPDERLRAQRGTLATALAERLAAADAPLPELRDLHERIKLLDAAMAGQDGRDDYLFVDGTGREARVRRTWRHGGLSGDLSGRGWSASPPAPGPI